MQLSPRQRNRVIWVLNAACPSRCAYCDIESQRAADTLSEAEVERVAKSILEAGFKEVIFVGGEPLLSPELPRALEVLRGRCSVAAFTGGIPGDPMRWIEVVKLGIERLVFSIDTGHDATNDLIRGRKGITSALLAFVEAVRRETPRVDLSINSVVAKSTVAHVASVWDRMRPYRPASWALTLAGDNFNGSPTAHLLDRGQLETLYFEQIPRLADRLREDRAELVVLPTPLPFLLAGAPPSTWRDRRDGLREELDAELGRYARGEYNRSFVERFGCPLVGMDISIGVSGAVHPCSQAPAIRDEYVMGDARETSLDDILAGDRLADFRVGIPHAPCARCWAPSNVPRELLRTIVRRAT